MSNPKRFDDYAEVVDCNECARYYDSSCDGVAKGSEKPCNCFLATRNVVIPSQIKSLEKRVKRLSIAGILSSTALVLHLLSHLLGWI